MRAKLCHSCAASEKLEKKRRKTLRKEVVAKCEEYKEACGKALKRLRRRYSKPVKAESRRTLPSRIVERPVPRETRRVEPPRARPISSGSQRRAEEHSSSEVVLQQDKSGQARKESLAGKGMPAAHEDLSNAHCVSENRSSVRVETPVAGTSSDTTTVDVVGDREKAQQSSFSLLEKMEFKTSQASPKRDEFEPDEVSSSTSKDASFKPSARNSGGADDATVDVRYNEKAPGSLDAKGWQSRVHRSEDANRMIAESAAKFCVGSSDKDMSKPSLYEAQSASKDGGSARNGSTCDASTTQEDASELRPTATGTTRTKASSKKHGIQRQVNSQPLRASVGIKTAVVTAQGPAARVESPRRTVEHTSSTRQLPSQTKRDSKGMTLRDPERYTNAFTGRESKRGEDGSKHRMVLKKDQGQKKTQIIDSSSGVTKESRSSPMVKTRAGHTATSKTTTQPTPARTRRPNSDVPNQSQIRSTPLHAEAASLSGAKAFQDRAASDSPQNALPNHKRTISRQVDVPASRPVRIVGQSGAVQQLTPKRSSGARKQKVPLSPSMPRTAEYGEIEHLKPLETRAAPQNVASDHPAQGAAAYREIEHLKPIEAHDHKQGSAPAPSDVQSNNDSATTRKVASKMEKLELTRLRLLLQIEKKRRAQREKKAVPKTDRPQQKAAALPTQREPQTNGKSEAESAPPLTAMSQELKVTFDMSEEISKKRGSLEAEGSSGSRIPGSKNKVEDTIAYLKGKIASKEKRKTVNTLESTLEKMKGAKKAELVVKKLEVKVRQQLVKVNALRGRILDHEASAHEEKADPTGLVSKSA